MMKKLVAWMLTITMIVTFVPIISFGAEEQQDSEARTETEAGIENIDETNDDSGQISEGVEAKDTDQSVRAAEGEDVDSGVYDGVPWRITSDYELIIGQEGQEYTYDYSESRDRDSFPWTQNSCRSLIETAKIEGTVYGNGSMSWMFYGCDNLTSLDLSGFDTSNVTNMWAMFSGCNSLTSVDLSGFDTSNVTDMSDMLKDCETLTNLNLKGFDTSKVTDMSDMFFNCRALTSLDLSRFDTRNVTNMSGIIRDCETLINLNLSGFDTRNVECMASMFYGCNKLTSLDLSGFDTSNVTDMWAMFSGCNSLTSVDLSGFDTSNVTDMSCMFEDCSSLTSVDLSGFDTRNVLNMAGMFEDCSSLTSVDLSGFDTSNVMNMERMFEECSSLISLDLSGFDASNVEGMSGMINGCSSLTTLKVGKNFNTYSDGEKATFPVVMHDSEDGTEYAAGDVIPSTDYQTYVSDLTTLPSGTTVNENNLYKLFNSYLDNNYYKVVSQILFNYCFEGMANRSGLADYFAEVKYNLRSGTIGSLINFANREKNIDNQRKEIAAELIHSLQNDPDIGDYLDLSTGKKANSALSKITGLLEKPDEELKVSEMKVIASNVTSNSKIQKQLVDCMKFLKTHHAEFEEWSDVATEAGRVLTVADAVVATYLIMAADEELVDDLLALVDKNSDLGQGLLLIKKDLEKGVTVVTIENITKELLRSEAPGLAKDLMTKKVIASMMGKETAGAVAIEFTLADTFWWGVSWCIAGAKADEVTESWMAINVVNDLNYARNSYRYVIKNDWNNGKTKPVDEMKANYSLLVEAYYCAMINCAEKVCKCVPEGEKQAIQYYLDKHGEMLSYKNYIKSCLKNANTAFTTANISGGVTITGIKGSGAKSATSNAELKASGLEKSDSSGTDKKGYIDIPDEIDGEKVVGIADNAFAGRTDITRVALPDSIESIGAGAFEGCTSLVDVYFGQELKSIGSRAFASCTDLETLDLPDSLEQIEDEAFDGANGLVIRGANGLVGESFADSNNIDFEAREKTVQEITVASSPSKTSYRLDEEFDKTGMTLNVTYTDGSTAVVDEGFGCWFKTDRQIGTNTMMVLYGDCTAEFNVEVTDDECTYNVYYRDEYGNDIHEKTTGTAAGGSTITVDALEIEGYEPVEESKEISIGVINDLTFEYSKIPKINIEDAEVECAEEVDYTGEQIKPEIRVTLGGDTLNEEDDYTLVYGENIEGEGIIEIEGTGDYEGFIYVSFSINKPEIPDTPDDPCADGHTWKHITNKATLTKNGSEYDQCTECGEKQNVKTIYYPKTFKLSATAYTYSGTVKKPAVTVKNSLGKTLSTASYTVTYSKNKYVGKATAKVTLKEPRYSGTKTLTFKINPKGTYISKLTPKKKAFTVTWKKQATQTTGYQIQYSLSSKFASGNKLVTVAKTGTTSKTISKLKAKKRYYVRVRTYKTVSGVRYYSAWSAKKYVKTK